MPKIPNKVAGEFDFFEFGFKEAPNFCRKLEAHLINFTTKGAYSRHKMIQEICFWIYMNEYLAQTQISDWITYGITKQDHHFSLPQLGGSSHLVNG